MGPNVKSLDEVVKFIFGREPSKTRLVEKGLSGMVFRDMPKNAEVSVDYWKPKSRLTLRYFLPGHVLFETDSRILTISGYGTLDVIKKGKGNIYPSEININLESISKQFGVKDMGLSDFKKKFSKECSDMLGHYVNSVKTLPNIAGSFSGEHYQWKYPEYNKKKKQTGIPFDNFAYMFLDMFNLIRFFFPYQSDSTISQPSSLPEETLIDKIRNSVTESLLKNYHLSKFDLDFSQLKVTAPDLHHFGIGIPIILKEENDGKILGKEPYVHIKGPRLQLYIPGKTEEITLPKQHIFLP